MGRFALQLVVGSLALAAVARAQAPRLALHWQAPTDCPSQSELHSEVERLLGGAIPEGPAITVDAVAARGPDGFTLRMTTEMAQARGERVLSAASCPELASAAALILALMIDPEAVAALEPAAPDPPAPPRPEPPPAALVQVAAALTSPSAAWARDAPSSPEAPPATLVGVGLGAAFLVDVGTLPAPAPGAGLEAVWQDRWVQGRLRFEWLSTQGARLASGAGAELSALGGAALVCGRPLEEIALCTGLHAGAVFGAGVGVGSPTSGTAGWVAGSVGGAFSWAPVEWLDLELRADLLIPFTRPTFFVTLPSGPADVFTLEPVAGRFALGGHLRF
ncbi:MAG: hypothetical protein IT378_26820 [Sandaracinaceae bacterium]|nr:hypothetical protein [Sandaracinaceae bacterium]